MVVVAGIGEVMDGSDGERRVFPRRKSSRRSPAIASPRAVSDARARVHGAVRAPAGGILLKTIGVDPIKLITDTRQACGFSGA